MGGGGWGVVGVSASQQWLLQKSDLNPFASGIQKVLLYPITGLFSVKNLKKFLAIKNFSVNDTMSGQPNKRISRIKWLVFFIVVVFLPHN